MTNIQPATDSEVGAVKRHLDEHGSIPPAYVLGLIARIEQQQAELNQYKQPRSPGSSVTWVPESRYRELEDKLEKLKDWQRRVVHISTLSGDQTDVWHQLMEETHRD